MAHDAASKMTEIAQLDAAVQDAVTHVSKRMKTRLRPVDRKVFAVIHSRLLEVKEGLSRDPSHCRIHADKILSTVQLVDESLGGDAAWDVSDSLKELLPLMASDDWVYRALLEEKGRSAEAPYGWKALSSEARLDIAQLDMVWRTMGSQIVLGGTLAVIVLVTLQTGLVRVASLDFNGTLNPVALYLVGLISGYSEPFALGLLKKVVELGK